MGRVSVAWWRRSLGFVELVLVAGCGSVVADSDSGPGGAGDAKVDSSPPVVMSTTPEPAEASLDEEELSITATFSESMDVDRLAEAFQLRAFGGAIPGEVDLDGHVATFTPSEPFAAGTAYVASITTGALDEAGNRLAERHDWVFTTRTTACVEPEGAEGCHETIASAIAASEEGDSIAVAAAGTYVENLVIDKTLTLLGGFQDDFERRDPSVARSAITPAVATDPVIRIEGDGTDTASVAPVVSGFSISGGRATDGGAFHITSSDVQLHDNVIAGNQASGRGGGVYAQFGSPRLVGNQIRSNTAVGRDGSAGGGIFLDQTRAYLGDNVIRENHALEAAGGGLFLAGFADNRGPVVLEGNRILDNQAGSAGIPGDGGGLGSAGMHVDITGGEITGNHVEGPRGGGLFAALSAVALRGVWIEGNSMSSADGTGGAVFADHAPLTLASSVVARHRDGLAAVWIVEESPSAIVNCTFRGNAGAAVHTSSSLTVANSIFQAEEVGVDAVVEPGENVLAVKNVFFENAADVRGFDLDPAVNADDDPKLDDSLHLAEGSALIDAGDPGPFSVDDRTFDLPAFDIDGEPRTQPGPGGSAAVDIGADEWATTVASQVRPPSRSGGGERRRRRATGRARALCGSPRRSGARRPRRRLL